MVILLGFRICAGSNPTLGRLKVCDENLWQYHHLKLNLNVHLSVKYFIKQWIFIKIIIITVVIGILESFEKFSGQNLCWSLFFNKTAGLQLATLLWRRLQHRSFPVRARPTTAKYIFFSPKKVSVWSSKLCKCLRRSIMLSYDNAENKTNLEFYSSVKSRSRVWNTGLAETAGKGLI